MTADLNMIKILTFKIYFCFCCFPQIPTQHSCHLGGINRLNVNDNIIKEINMFYQTPKPLVGMVLPYHVKTGFLHMRKLSCRSAVL